ncbi:MAG: CorA family divalent cation transporter [Breznakia sp.]
MYEIKRNGIKLTNDIEHNGLFLLTHNEIDETIGNLIYNGYAKVLQSHVIRHETHSDIDIIAFPLVESKEDTITHAFIKKNKMFIVGDYDLLLDMFEEMNFEHISLTKVTIMQKMLQEFSNSTNRRVVELESQILDLEDEIISDVEISDETRRILKFRRILLAMKRQYDELMDVMDALVENENKLFDEHAIRRFDILRDRYDRNYRYIQSLLDYLNEVREAYQSAVDIRQNDIMRLFTIISAIFLPLTLLAGWYGMNFKNMPELDWRYGYLSVIIISVIIVVFCIYYFKRNKWF